MHTASRVLGVLGFPERPASSRASRREETVQGRWTRELDRRHTPVAKVRTESTTSRTVELANSPGRLSRWWLREV